MDDGGLTKLQKASAVQSYVLEGPQTDLVSVHARPVKRRLVDSGSRKSILKSLGAYVHEHFANAAYGVYPIESDSKVAAIIVGNKYSPNNFW